jgi:hypothetical protein
MWGSAQQTAKDAQVTYVHSVDADGKLGEMLSFQIIPDGRGDWENSWTKDGGWDTNSGGWPYGQGGRGRPADIGVKFQDYTIGYPVHPNLGGGRETVNALPFLKVETHSKDGSFIETFSDQGHTQAIQFVYSGPDRKQLIQQTYGHMESGKWVQTTTRSKDFISQLTERFQVGGNQFMRGGEPRIEQTANGFRVTTSLYTPDSPWTPPSVDRPPNSNFKQRWQGTVTLEFKKVGTIDGVDQYELVNVTSQVTHVTTRSDFVNDGDTKYHDGAPLSGLGFTQADVETLVARWNERAVL